MKTHTQPRQDPGDLNYHDFESELACGTEESEQALGRRLMKSWVGSAMAAMSWERTGAPRPGRFGGGSTVAALRDRIDELVRENLELRAELVRRVQIETALRRAKPGAKIAAKLDRATIAPGHDLAVAPRAKRSASAADSTAP